MMPGILLTREMFLISHGSWQNRWKISIIPEGKIRWTVKTTVGVCDIDSRTRVASGIYHHVTGTFNGSDFELYVDGELETFTGFSGRLLTPAIDLTVGQMLPTDANYNFQGVIDDIQVYSYALTYPQVQEVYHRVTRVRDPADSPVPLVTALAGTYPNPFNPNSIIRYQISEFRHVRLVVYDLFGREVTTLVDEVRQPGTYTVNFDARLPGRQGSHLASGVYFCRFTAGNHTEVARMLLVR
jgi:hypothetical protein